MISCCPQTSKHVHETSLMLCYSLHQKKVYTLKLAKYSNANGARIILGGMFCVLLKLISVPYVLSTTPLFKCMLSFGRYCISLNILQWLCHSQPGPGPLIGIVVNSEHMHFCTHFTIYWSHVTSSTAHFIIT